MSMGFDSSLARMLKLIGQIGYWSLAIAYVLAEEKFLELAQAVALWIAVEPGRKGRCRDMSGRGTTIPAVR